ncbi:hypothetical protein QKW52_07440 [Bacillus sonorensis]|nr:hypothetical protein [Bacillus sonorensis]
MKVSHEVPTPHEYLELRKAAGLRAIDEDAAKTALNRSIFSTVVRESSQSSSAWAESSVMADAFFRSLILPSSRLAKMRN